MRSFLNIAVIFFIVSQFCMCKKNDETGLKPTFGEQTTTSISQNSAMVLATINPHGVETYFTLHYKDSTDLNFTSIELGSSNIDSEYLLVYIITDLEPQTSYTYYFSAENNGGIVSSEKTTFYTLSGNSYNTTESFKYNTSSTTNIVMKTTDGYSFKGKVNIVDLVDSESKLEIDSVCYLYEFSVFFGEPTRRGAVKWVGSTGTNKLSMISIKCKVYNANGVATGYYYSYSPSTSSTENEYGWDISGSPSWSAIFFDSNNTYATTAQAQDIFKSGFYLADPIITSLNGFDKTK